MAVDISTMNEWMWGWFDGAAAAQNGGIVRRAVDDVHQRGDIDAAIAEAHNRGWHMIESGDQYVLLCNDGAMQVLA